MFVDDLRTLEECLLFARGAGPEAGTYETGSRGEGYRDGPGDLFQLMGSSPALSESALAEALFDRTDEGPPPEDDLRASDEDLADTEDGSFGRSSKSRSLTFARAPILPPEISQRNTQSALSMLLSESNMSPREATAHLNRITVYLPSGDTLEVGVKSSQRVADVIKRILLLHRKSGKQPSLSANTTLYQLRIHDIDGKLYFKLSAHPSASRRAGRGLPPARPGSDSGPLRRVPQRVLSLPGGGQSRVGEGSRGTHPEVLLGRTRPARAQRRGDHR